MPKVKKFSSHHTRYNSGFTTTPYVTHVDVTENDVLLGRGDHAVHHEGNIRFRQVISNYQAQYLQTDDNDQKNKLAGLVVSTIVGRNGRFLRKATAIDIDKLKIPRGSNSWIPTTDEKGLIKKIKQTFRDQRDSELKRICKAQEAAAKRNDERKRAASQRSHENTLETAEESTASYLLRGRSDHISVSDTDRVLVELERRRGAVAAAAVAMHRRQQEQHLLAATAAAASPFLLQQQINAIPRQIVPSVLIPSTFQYPAARISTTTIHTPNINSLREQALLQRIRLADSLESLTGSNNKRYRTLSGLEP